MCLINHTSKHSFLRECQAFHIFELFTFYDIHVKCEPQYIFSNISVSFTIYMFSLHSTPISFCYNKSKCFDYTSETLWIFQKRYPFLILCIFHIFITHIKDLCLFHIYITHCKTRYFHISTTLFKTCFFHTVYIACNVFNVFFVGAISSQHHIKLLLPMYAKIIPLHNS